MPLTKSSSKAAFSRNVSEMVRAGHPQRQALAAAYRTQRAARADGGGIDYQKDQSRYSDGDAYRRMPLSENIDDLRNEDRAKYMERDQAQRAREVAALRTGGLRRQVNRPMAPISRASGGRVQVKNMLDEAAGKLEDGLTSVGKAGGGGLGFLSQFFGQGGGGGLSGSFSPQAWQQSLQQTGDPWRSAFQSFTGRGQPPPAAPQAPAPAQGMRLGYAEGGELPYRGGEITPWYVRSEAQQMRRAASGPIQSIVPGRTDALSMSVKRGSYVVPADVVSGMPGAQGNSAAGHKILENMFTKGPYGMSLPRGGGSRGAFPRLPATPRAEGGLVGNPEGGEDDLVDIDAAGGEHILDPEVAQVLGNGDPELGFKILDNFVKKIRDMHINTLKKLPGPKQS